MEDENTFFPDVFEKNIWYDALTYFPSQCFMYKVHQGFHYVLYLRWRWQDPWRGYIIKNAWNYDSVSEELSDWGIELLETCNFKEDELDVAKQELIAMFNWRIKDDR